MAQVAAGTAQAETGGGVIAVGDQIEALCQRLGLDSADVAMLLCEPTRIVANVYLLNENGKKHIQDDGEPATRWLTFRVTS